MPRALRFIQKTIQVTTATARIEVAPAKSCSPLLERAVEVKESNAPNPKESAAAATTPIQIAGRPPRRSERMR